MYVTPILLLVFNRPDITQQTFDAIRKVKPKFLFIAADGPRTGNLNDAKKCKAVRYITDQIDWFCSVKTLYRDENLGCGRGPSDAITWFFSYVDEGIIIEDDCLVSVEGFLFYEKMLLEHRYNNQVGVITVNNLILKWRHKYSQYIMAGPGAPTMGCWATWRRAWNNFEFSICSWTSLETKYQIEQNITKNEYKYWSHIFDSIVQSKPTDFWDYQWHFARMLHLPITIVSTVNMVSNIGFGPDATHTISISNIAALPILKPNLATRSLKYRDKLFDWIVFEKFYRPTNISLVKKIIMKLLMLIFR